MKKLKIEIADTPSLRSKGLMHRKDIGDDEGMLFKFPDHDYLKFWMKDTYIPLDIAFLDDDGVITQISEMYPLSYRLVSSKMPCKMALEVKHGWFLKNDIGVGDKIGGINNKTYRSAQAVLDNPDLSENADPSFPDMNMDGIDDSQQDESNLGNTPDVQVELSIREKVRVAEQKNLAMQIIYQSRRSGQTLPPRKILPVPGEGYPIGVSEGGEYFTAFDASPTINGGEWEIIGNQIKRFLFNNIIALELLDFAE
jgi:uncharacterized membrane protein (UPF0127 family)